MQDFTPIPIPFEQRWREFRIRVVPVIVFSLTALLVAGLWKQSVAPATLTGLVEPVKASVDSPINGALVELTVDRFHVVKAGMPIGLVRPGDWRQDMEFMRSQLALLQASEDPQLAMRRSALDYQKLRLSFLQQKIDLSTAKINLQFASSDLERAEKLLEGNSITGKSYDDRLKAKQAYESQVEERGRLVAELGQELERLKVPEPERSEKDTLASVEKIIRAQEEKMRSIEKGLGLVTLTAPIDGMIVSVERRAGENVAAGEAILKIDAIQGERIIGYVRQPISAEPQAGMVVEVRSRSRSKEVAKSQIIHVGVGFELIENVDLHPIASRPETGLPIEVAMPPGLKLRPGELVDLLIR